MLIQFTIKNHLSFKDAATLSLIPGKERSLTNHIVKGEKNKDISVLKSALIFGGNASGKSNLVKGLDFFRKFVISGNENTGDNIYLNRFLLDESSRNEPSEFDVVIKSNGRFYNYRIAVSNEKVIKEELFKVTSNSDKLIFSRKYEESTGNYVYDYKGLKPKNDKKKFVEFIFEGTLKTSLVLTECIKRNVPQNILNPEVLEDIFDWFNNKLKIVFPNSKVKFLEINLVEDEKFNKKFCEILRKFDSGIDGLELSNDNIDELNLPEALLNDIKTKSKPGLSSYLSLNKKSYIIENSDGLKALSLRTRHKINESDNYELFEIENESDGTKRMFDLIPVLLGLTDTSKELTIVIDEIDRSLHPLLSKEFFSVFYDNSINKNTQLIVTTHEENLLDLKMIRKDEIYFVQKNKKKSSELYSLQDFLPRFDKQIRNAYLLGRFGGIPKIKKSYGEKNI